VLAQTFLEISGTACKSFVELLRNEEFRCLKIAEINACGTLHTYLKDHPNLYYSEWVPHAKPGELYDGVRCEDLQCLTYPDSYFDIILTSETLEHVPDPDRAWREISRTLKGGGFHIFTIPIVPWQRETIKRARVVGGRREDLLEPVYHSPWGQEDVFVYTDFGTDIIEKLNAIGLNTEVFYLSPETDLDVAMVFRSHKTGGHVEVGAQGVSPLLEWTGERYLPWLEEAAIGYEHLHRYAYATQFVQNKRVLDLACGEGYGSYFLAKTAESVVGIDIEERAIKHARNKYIKQNLEFKVGSITRIPITGTHLFDVAVCFEALEHIEEHQNLLSEVKRLLAPDGILIVSTPNKKVYTDEPQFKNPFHVHELYFDEFRELFQKYFKHVQFLGQRIYCNSNIWPVFPGAENKVVEYVIDRNPKEFVFVENDKRIPLYFIAIASDADRGIEERGSALIDVSDALLKQKDGQIAAHTKEQDRLTKDIGQLSATVQAQQQALVEKDEHASRIAEDRDRLVRDVTELQSALRSNQQALVGKEEHSNQLASEIAQLQIVLNSHQQALLEKEEHANRLAEDRDRLARELAQLQVTLQVEQKALAEKEADTKQQAADRERLACETGQLQAEIEVRRKELDERKVRIRSLEELIQQRETILSQIYSSHGWKALTAYYQLRNKALPDGTRRRKSAKYVWECLWKSLLSNRAHSKAATTITHRSHSVLTWRNFGKALRHLKTFGFVGTYQKLKEKLAHSGYALQRTRLMTGQPVAINPAIKGEDVTTEEVTISVVIPTKNGGDDFRRIVAMIARQKGFREVEIIIVDSGSIDKTIELAEQFGAKVIEILPEEFTHSYARNLGARHASGQYLLFTVQDALPPSESWLSELFNVIKNNRVVAVSCAEFPAESADLFYRAISWNHYRFLEVDNNDRLLSKGSAEDHISLRKNGQLSDLACLISKDVFAEYEYKTDYGEDLDLGLRLIRDGHAIAFLGSTRIIHSHNRPAYYYLKRAYVENLFVPKIFPDYPVLSRNFERIVSDIAFTYQAISSLVAEGAWELQLPCRTMDFSCGLLRKFEEVLKTRSPFSTRIINNSSSDNEFEDFLTRIMNEDCLNKMGIDSAEGILGEAVMNFTRMVLAYMEQTYDFVDDHVAEDFRSSLHKAFAYQCGAQFAGCFLKHRGSGKSQLEQIHLELSKGV
jgi:2-polyprenyl-3-methyl-5-hydroxy-6-metoxy-1,4-benzoquinol methylase/glycosyltransferase involved in cell wall biosynthesis